MTGAAIRLSFMKLSTGMNKPDDSVFIDHEGDRGPAALFGIRPPAPQRGPICVETHGKGKSQAFACGPRSRHAPIARRLRMKNSDHDQPLFSILAVQLPQRRRRCGAERTSVRPPANQHDLAFERLYLKRRGMKPVLELERRGCQTNAIFPALDACGSALRMRGEQP